jgi:hypothetical protein
MPGVHGGAAHLARGHGRGSSEQRQSHLQSRHYIKNSARPGGGAQSYILDLSRQVFFF